MFKYGKKLFLLAVLFKKSYNVIRATCKIKYALLSQKPRSKGVKVDISSQIDMRFRLWHKWYRKRGNITSFCTFVKKGLTFTKIKGSKKLDHRMFYLQVIKDCC